MGIGCYDYDLIYPATLHNQRVLTEMCPMLLRYHVVASTIRSSSRIIPSHRVCNIPLSHTICCWRGRIVAFRSTKRRAGSRQGCATRRDQILLRYRASSVVVVPDSAKRIPRMRSPTFICSDVALMAYVKPVPSFLKTLAAHAFLFKTCE